MKSFSAYMKEEIELEEMSQYIDTFVLNEKDLFKQLGTKFKKLVKGAAFKTAATQFKKEETDATAIAAAHGFQPEQFQDMLVSVNLLKLGK